jgi:putative photosynthetic complex assembly protein
MAQSATLRPRQASPLLIPAVIVTALVAVILFIRLHGPPASLAPEGQALASIDLFFEDRADGAVVVRDAATGRVVRELEPGTNGFIRATLRGLVRERRLGEIGAERPFRVARWPDGRLTLGDMATGRVVDLLAFGQTQVEAFQSLLDAGGDRR